MLAACALAPTAALALDPFEIQVYDGTANNPGELGLEIHLNHVASGQRTAAAPELAPNGQIHFTLEPSLGVTPFWELGCYLQSALLPDGSFQAAGFKLRSKFVTPPSFSARWRLGVNLELSRLPDRYDRSRWGSEVRPIAAFENARWLVVVNPILGIPLGAPDASSGPTFEPAAMAKLKLGTAVAIGAEYYSGLGPISSLAPLRDQGHYLYEALDILSIPSLELNVGIGEGLTSASSRLVLKAIVGYRFGGDARLAP